MAAESVADGTCPQFEGQFTGEGAATTPQVTPGVGDPLEAFLVSLVARGVPLSLLVAHGSHGLRWLQAHAKDRFCLSWRAADGALISRRVTASELLCAADALGWKPMPSEQDTYSPAFEDAIYYRYKGVHWYATDYDECTAMPLALPQDVRDSARARIKAAQARLRRREAAARRAEQRHVLKRAKKVRAEVLASVAEEEQRNAAEQGSPISKKVAWQRAEAAWQSAVERISGSTLHRDSRPGG